MNQDLVSRNEKVQVQVKRVHISSYQAKNLGSQALRERYKDVKMKNLKNAAKLRRLKFFSAYIVPAILAGEIWKTNYLPFSCQLSCWYTLELEYSTQRLFKI